MDHPAGRHRGRGLARRRAFPVREPGRVPDREVGAHQPGPGGRAGAVGHGLVRWRLPQRLALDGGAVRGPGGRCPGQPACGPVQPARGQRRGHRHRPDAARHRPGLLPGQALDPAPGSAAASPAVQAALQVNALLPLGLVLAGLMSWAFANTRMGLLVRLAGDSADAARALGYSVGRIRWAATAGGGLIAGLGGASLTLFYPGSWNEGISSGQGLIAVALVIFARWSPLRCVGAAALFGGAGAIGPALQSVGIGWGYHLFNTVPYVLTLLILVITCRPGSVAAGSPGELSSR